MVLYTAHPRIPAGEHRLVLTDVHDRALVLVDGEVAGTGPEIPLRGNGNVVRLEVLVENLGRVNYGPGIGRHKGLLGPVLVDRRTVQRDLTWDEVVFVDTAFDIARDRGTRRDADMFGGVEAAGRAFDLRYHAACRRYLAEVSPATQATIVIGNDDLANPELRRIGPPSPVI